MKRKIIFYIIFSLLLSGGFAAFMIIMTSNLEMIQSPQFGTIMTIGVATFVVLVIGSIFLFQRTLLSGSLKKRAQLMKTGEKAVAVVLSVQDTGITMNDIYPCVRMELEIKPISRSPYKATVEAMVSRISIPRVGDQIPVLFNPNNLQEIAINGAPLA